MLACTEKTASGVFANFFVMRVWDEAAEGCEVPPEIAAGYDVIAEGISKDAFGNTVLSSGSLAGDNCYRFSTKEQDDESGLYYYGYRYLDVGIGRWTQRDPIGEDGGIALYGFVQNRTADRVDLLGLDDVEDVLGVFEVGGKAILYNLAVKAANLAPGLPRDLLFQYMFRNGQEYILTKQQVFEELKPETSLLLSRKFVANLKASASAGGRGFRGRYELPAGTALNGTLGRHTVIADVEVHCAFGPGGRGFGWAADGTAVIDDTYDFKPWSTWNIITGDGGRGRFGETRTALGDVFIPGQGFHVTSEPFDVHEHDGDRLNGWGSRQ